MMTIKIIYLLKKIEINIKSMRVISKLSVMFVAVVCALTSWSCEQTVIGDDNNNDNNTPSVETSVVFDTLELNIGYEECTNTVNYTINNGINGIDIVAEPTASWISDIKAKDGVLSFKATRNNDNQPREAKIKVKYPNIEDIIIKITQQQFSAITFELSVTNQTSTSCTSLVTPSNDDYAYIAYMAEVDYLLSLNITMAEELFNDDYDYYMGIAEQYEAPLLKEFLLANYFAYQGEYSIDWTGMVPGKEYVLYVYAIEFNDENTDYYLASPVTYQMVTLDAPKLQSVTFDVEIDTYGPKADYKITPKDWEGHYYLTVYAESDYMYRSQDELVDESYTNLVSDVWLNSVSELLASGLSVDNLMNIMCLKGYTEYSELLKADTNYAMVIYAIDMIDGLPQVASTPQVVNFRTKEVGPSDMTFEFKVENNYVRVADVTITPSNNDPYTVGIVATKDIPDSTDKEIIAWLNSNFTMDLYQGEIFSPMNTLDPDTDYTIFAYGYYGGVVTTDLYRYEFSTEPEGVCENSVLRVEFNGPYSLSELEAYDPDKYYQYGMFETMGWYAMWAEIFTEVPSNNLFYCVYSAQEFSVYGEEYIFEDLVSFNSPKSMLLTGESGELYVMCAVTMDYRGNYSEMWVSEPFMFNYDETTKRPLEELIEKIVSE